MSCRVVARSSAEYIAYFWSRVDGGADCWEWAGSYIGGRDARSRYGGVPTGRQNSKEYAHRLSWMLANAAPIPAGMQVCHRCDNPRCVRPDHLFLGTGSANALDKIEKGRHITPCGSCGRRAINGHCRSCVARRRAEKAESERAEKLARQRSIAPIITRDQLDTLPERWARIVVRYYGLLGEPRASEDTIGAEEGITRQRVSQIVISAFRRLGIDRPAIPCTIPGESLTSSAA